MTLIHPTAIIERGAQIDTTVEIGPYTMIGAQVSIAAQTKIGAHTVIEGCTQIGEANRIGNFAALGGAPQDMKYNGEPTRLVIGARNMIREFTSIHTGTVQDKGVTQIGDDNWIMGYVHIAHDCMVGNHAIFSSNAQIAGHVQVGDWAILGGMSGVHQGVRIGAHAMLGAGSILVQDLPPFVIAAGEKAKPYGINTGGLRRRHFTPEAIAALQKAYRLLYKAGLSFEQAMMKLTELAEHNASMSTHLYAFVEFIRTTKRGITR